MPGISPAEWRNIEDHCTYEAAKATAAADPMTAVTYTKHRLFIMCAKLKGATYVGLVTMPEEQWEPLSTRCKAEAASAVSGQPASRKKDELKEDLKFECFKRNGVVFHDNVYL